MKKITLHNLLPGQVVALFGCTETAKVLRRIGTNMYELEYKGKTITQARRQLGVWVHDRYMFGTYNASNRHLYVK